MNGLAFFDTNTLVYTGDKSSPEKQSRAIGLFTGSQQRGLAVISLQVLQEYFVTITRKLGVDPELPQQKLVPSDLPHGTAIGGVPIVNPFL